MLRRQIWTNHTSNSCKCGQTIAFAGEETCSDTRFSDGKGDYNGQKFRSQRSNDQANYVGIPEEYGDDYGQELQDNGYVAAEELTYPNPLEEGEEETPDVGYLVLAEIVK